MWKLNSITVSSGHTPTKPNREEKSEILKECKFFHSPQEEKSLIWGFKDAEKSVSSGETTMHTIVQEKHYNMKSLRISQTGQLPGLWTVGKQGARWWLKRSNPSWRASGSWIARDLVGLFVCLFVLALSATMWFHSRTEPIKPCLEGLVTLSLSLWKWSFSPFTRKLPG